MIKMTNVMNTIRSSARAINATLKQTVPAGVPIVTSAFIPNVNKVTVKSPRVLVPALGMTFLKGVGFNVVFLEVGDYAGAKINDRRRRRRVEEIINENAGDLTPEQMEELRRLTRASERRTFGQFIRDIPSRTFRRVARACIVEAGWWVWILSSPVWLTATILGTAYTWLIVLPLTAAMAIFWDKKIDLDKWMAPALFLKKVVHHTFGRGWRIMDRGFSMPVHNTGKFRSTDDAFEVIDLVQTEAYDHISKIVDQHTAFEWGAHTAELIDALDVVSYEDKLRAYSQFGYWADSKMAPEFRKPVKQGFRSGTPFIHRDLVSA